MDANPTQNGSLPAETVGPSQASAPRPQNAAYSDKVTISRPEQNQNSSSTLEEDAQWLDTLSPDYLHRLLGGTVAGSNQDGGHHATWPDNRAESIDPSLYNTPCMGGIDGIPNSQAQSNSATSWVPGSHWQPTPESSGTSSLPLVRSRWPSRQASDSSRIPSPHATGESFTVTPSEMGTAIGQSLLAASGTIHSQNQQPSDAASARNSSPSLLLQEGIENSLVIAEGPEQSEQASPAPTKTTRKRVLTEQGRNRARIVRQIGSCVRCKMYKIRCDCGNPCGRCTKVEGSFRKYYSPCYREDILNVQLVRLGSGKSGEAHSHFKNYQYINLDDQPKTLELKWQLPMSCQADLPTFFAAIREFKPRYDDLVHEEWQVNGKIQRLELPAYAASETDILTNSLEEFIEKCQPTMQALMLEQLTNKLSLATFHEAIRYAENKGSEVIQLALRVRTTALLSAGWGSIIGEETLGTPLADGANVGYCDNRPTPVPLAHQFDVIFINSMHRVEREVVKLLQKKIFQKEPKPWYEIFLAYFVMLTHLQFIHTQAVGFMRASAGQVSFIIKDMVAKWDYSAGNMLHHYLFVLRGHLPFAVAKKNPEQLRKRDNLDEEALKYINHANFLLSNIDSSEASHDDVTPSLEVDQSWTRQLFREQY